MEFEVGTLSKFEELASFWKAENGTEASGKAVWMESSVLAKLSNLNHVLVTVRQSGQLKGTVIGYLFSLPDSEPAALITNLCVGTDVRGLGLVPKLLSSLQVAGKDHPHAWAYGELNFSKSSSDIPLRSWFLSLSKDRS